MTDPTAPTYAEPNDPEDPVDAIPRDAEPIRRPRRHQHDSDMPDGLVAGFIGFGLGVITALAFRQVKDNYDDDDDREYRKRYRRVRRR